MQRNVGPQDADCARTDNRLKPAHETSNRVAGRLAPLWFLILLVCVIYLFVKIVWPAVAWFIRQAYKSAAHTSLSTEFCIRKPATIQHCSRSELERFLLSCIVQELVKAQFCRGLSNAMHQTWR